MIDSRIVQVCTCGKCGREFIPLRCPSCKSPNWNGPSNAVKKRASRKVESIPPEPVIETPEEYVVPIESQSTGKPLRDEKPGKCPHHKMRGELCYKCDKKFGLPVIKKIGA